MLKRVIYMSNNKYAFLMIDYETPMFIKQIHNQLQDLDLYKGDNGCDTGIETQTHVTLVPCLDNNVCVDDIKQHLEPLHKYTIFLNNISSFNKEEYDVLKCDAQCDFLHMTNKKIREFFPSYSEYQDYHPHLTIAYLNKGVCDKFCKEILTPLVVLKPKHFTFSWYDKNDEQQRITFL